MTKKFATNIVILLLALVLLLSIILNFYLISDSSETDKNTDAGDNNVSAQEQEDLARDIVENGGYVLLFRHGNREKWIDVYMYDAKEATEGIDGSETYFNDAVCLSDEGKIQVRVMGEVLQEIKLPVGKVVSTPSCRARQTASALFGTEGEINNQFLHYGPFNETREEFNSGVKDEILKLPPEEGVNTVISAHNSVVSADIFDEVQKDIDFNLEEGGFYVMKIEDGNLVLVDKFHSFKDFNKIFFDRPE